MEGLVGASGFEPPASRSRTVRSRANCRFVRTFISSRDGSRRDKGEIRLCRIITPSREHETLLTHLGVQLPERLDFDYEPSAGSEVDQINFKRLTRIAPLFVTNSG